MNSRKRASKVPLDYSLERMNAALLAFMEACPAFNATSILDELRSREYGRLDELDQVYLDYTGGGLYARSQLQQHHELLERNVFGNPHSRNPTSLAMTELVERARSYILEYFHAPPEEYVAIFTPNASGALKLVGESYPFGPGDHYLITSDNHNSVNGIREFARARGAKVTYLPVTLPDLRLDMDRVGELLEKARPGGHSLFAFPAQSNFSGVQHPLSMIDEARARGWDVLVDSAAFVPTNRLDVGKWLPDFVPLSFYKIFGYPTGIGCLLARKVALAKLKRPWFAGGTITIASVQGDGHYLAEDEAAFEDGTINYLDIPAVEIGLRHIASIDVETIHQRVMALTGWLLESLLGLRHSGGRELVRIHGPKTLHDRGATLGLTLYDRDGRPFDERRVEELAGEARISLRTGCFCNPGAGEVAHGLASEEIGFFFRRDRAVSFSELRDEVRNRFGKSVSTIRVSLGLATSFADVYRFMAFAAAFLNKTTEEIGEAEGRTFSGMRDIA